MTEVTSISNALLHLRKTDCDGCNDAADVIDGLVEQYEALTRDYRETLALNEEKLLELTDLQEQLETLDEALRTILDVTEKWTRRMTDEERLLHIDTIAKTALSKVSKTKR